MLGRNFTIIGFLILLIALYYVDRYQCSVKTRDIGEYEFTVIGGCMVKPEGTDKFIPIENYRVI